jgi:hypothetical protein
MRWNGKTGQPIQFLAAGDQIDAPSILRNTVASRVEQTEVDSIPEFLQLICYLAGQVAAAVVQDIRNVLEKEGERLQIPYVAKVLNIKLPSGVLPKSLRMFMDLAELCPTDPGIGLAGRPPNDHVNRRGGMPKLAQQVGRLNAADVPGQAEQLSTLFRLLLMEVGCIRPGSPGLLLHAPKNLESGALKAEG